MQEIMQYTTYGIALIGGLSRNYCAGAERIAEIKKDSDKCCRACGISDPLSGYADCFMYMVCRKNHVVLCYGGAARCFSGVSRCDRRMGKNKRNLGSNTIQKEKSMKQTDPIWKKEAMHIWMILRGMQEAIIIQNLREMSTGGDSRDVRDSHGVLFISSGNW